MEIDEKTRGNLTTIFMPSHSTIVPGADDANPSDEDDIAYNEWCTKEIKKNLEHFHSLQMEDYRRAVVERDAVLAGLNEGDPIPARWREPVAEPGAPMARTRYPGDDEGSEDVVSLDESGNVIVLDTGTR